MTPRRLCASGILLAGIFAAGLAIAGGGRTGARDSNGLLPLHHAAGRGDTALVARLLDEGADPLALDSKMGVSVLHKAVYSGSAATVSLLLLRGGGALLDLPSPSNGDTPLHDAIAFPSADLGVVDTLLKHGASLSIRNRAGLTALELAHATKRVDMEARLKEAAERRHTSAGRALMEAVRKNDRVAVGRLLAERTTSVNEPDDQGFTPLIWAARQGYIEITEALLRRGADPNQNDVWMRANAGHKAGYWGRDKVIPLLVRHGLKVDALGGYNGYTALHDAVVGNHVATVRNLLAAGARVDIRGHDGKTAMDLARQGKNRELVELLTNAQKRGR